MSLLEVARRPRMVSTTLALVAWIAVHVTFLVAHLRGTVPAVLDVTALDLWAIFAVAVGTFHLLEGVWSIWYAGLLVASSRPLTLYTAPLHPHAPRPSLQPGTSRKAHRLTPSC